jgi:hypothetical protein
MNPSCLMRRRRRLLVIELGIKLPLADAMRCIAKVASIE